MTREQLRELMRSLSMLSPHLDCILKFWVESLSFRGTRVPFKILIDYLEGGDTLDQFLEQYPSVSLELAIAAIEEARLSLVAQLK